MVKQVRVNNPNLFIPRDSTTIELRDGSCNDNAFIVPLKIWVIRENEADFDGLPDDKQIQQAIDNINYLFQNNGLNVRFYVSCLQYRTDDDLVNVGDLDIFSNQYSNLWHQNIYIVKSIVSNGESASGVYSPHSDNIYIKRDAFNNASSKTLTHELGHAFSLEHTHRNADRGDCVAEPVSREKQFPWYCFKSGTMCFWTADGFCDTQADPGLLWNETDYKVDANCNYTWGETDNWGSTYIPNTRNIMSYSPNQCRDYFSNEQGAAMMGIMINSYFQDINNSWFLKPDSYEPDNTHLLKIPRNITVGETQCHSLFCSFGFDECTDDVDWLRFKTSDDDMIGNYKIEIANVGNYQNPVQTIKVWHTDANGERTTQVTTINSQVGSSRYFEVPCANNNRDYLIEVIRSETGHGKYKISLGSSIILPTLSASDCAVIGQDMVMNNVPSGATVQWVPSQNITLNTFSGNVARIMNISNPNAPLSIIIYVNYGGCRYVFTHNFSNVSGVPLPAIGTINTLVRDAAACEPLFTFSISPVSGATSYSWSCGSNNSAIELECLDTHETEFRVSANFQPFESGTIIATLQAFNSCGGVVSKTKTVTYSSGECEMRIVDGGGGDEIGKSVSVIPNPVDNVSNILLKINDPTAEAAEITNEYQITITSLYGEVKYMNTTTQREISLNVENYISGLYNVLVISNNSTFSAQFLIQN
ncbi:MAG: zinc-dependent metalloprotease [Saprospiraceae bacterium]|nr:zinc-dependent metalloprotease [Saprospiraceae bacterium]MBP7699888.1 zinc-dependent metalloprotease [Saprospiraceae bacterium]